MPDSNSSSQKYRPNIPPELVHLNLIRQLRALFNAVQMTSGRKTALRAGAAATQFEKYVRDQLLKIGGTGLSLELSDRSETLKAFTLLRNRLWFERERKMDVIQIQNAVRDTLARFFELPVGSGAELEEAIDILRNLSNSIES